MGFGAEEIQFRFDGGNLARMLGSQYDSQNSCNSETRLGSQLASFLFIDKNDLCLEVCR